MNSFRPLLIHWNPYRWNVKPYSPGTFATGTNSLATSEQLQIITDSREPFPLECKALQPGNLYHWKKQPTAGTFAVGINSLATCEHFQIITDSLEPFPLECKAGTFAIGPTAREPLPLEETTLQPVNSFRSILIPGNLSHWNKQPCS